LRTIHRGNKVEPAGELAFAEVLKKIESKILRTQEDSDNSC
jgi:hypothetical protein